MRRKKPKKKERNKVSKNKIQCDQKFSDDSKSLLRANGYIFFRNSNCRTNLEVTHFYFWFNLLNVIDSFFVVRDFATSMFFSKVEH